MAGNGFSGQFGTANFGEPDESASTEIVEVTKWTLDATAAVHKYNSNTTGGHKRAVPGVKDTKGTIEIKISSETGAQFGPGDEVSLELHVDDSGNNYFDIAHAVIAGAPIEVELDDGQPVSATYNFEASDLTGNGILANLAPAS